MTLPVPYRVTQRRAQTADSVTLRLDPVRSALPVCEAGQFMMLYAHAVGEVPISVSGRPSADGGGLEHTIRAVGAVSRALHDAAPGSVLGVRGPYGTGWNVGAAEGRDLVLVAGGVGLAPLRPVVLDVLQRREHFGRVVLISGARSPGDYLFADEQRRWAAQARIEVLRTVDVPAAGWTGEVGFVTEPLARLRLDPARTTALLCGPEPMMRFCARSLLRAGLAAADIHVSLERNMQCGIGHCGHCQLGPLLVCRDGPVVGYGVAAALLDVREL